MKELRQCVTACVFVCLSVCECVAVAERGGEVRLCVLCLVLAWFLSSYSLQLNCSNQKKRTYLWWHCTPAEIQTPSNSKTHMFRHEKLVSVCNSGWHWHRPKIHKVSATAKIQFNPNQRKYLLQDCVHDTVSNPHVLLSASPQLCNSPNLPPLRLLIVPVALCLTTRRTLYLQNYSTVRYSSLWSAVKYRNISHIFTAEGSERQLIGAEVQ